MKLLVDLFKYREELSQRKVITILCYIVLGLTIMLLFSGKSRVDLETIAVSQDERYIACFETGNGHRIRCFHIDGTQMFDYQVDPVLSSGGYCTIWFENEVLCVLFYRTNKIASFSMDGTILNIVDSSANRTQPEFYGFVQKKNQYVFYGNEIDVIYNKQSFWDYWLFGAERSLSIIPHEGDSIVICTWTAED